MASSQREWRYVMASYRNMGRFRFDMSSEAIFGPYIPEWVGQKQVVATTAGIENRDGEE